MRNVVVFAICLAGMLMFSTCKNNELTAPPSRVENFTATAGYERVELAWEAPLDDGGSIITGYEITMDDWTNKVTKTANQLSDTYSGLTNDTEYSFKIRALNTHGAGAESILTATPKAMDVRCGISIINDEEYLKMCAVPNRVPINSSFKVVIENHTKNDFVWGLPYRLEYLNGTFWKPIELDIVFTLVAYFLKPEETAEQGIFLDSKYIQTIGKYRIRKPYLPCGSSPYDLYAEFEVIESR